jgi:SAM-dependent methyltransferase
MNHFVPITRCKTMSAVRKKWGLRVLPKAALIKTGPFDHADWNFRPLLGWIIRRRFKLILSLLPQKRVQRILEVGYGSGMFMPELVERCDELYGIDIHPMNQEVTDRLREFHVEAHLTSASAESIPFENDCFDYVVAMSSLEFVEDQELASQELQRVIKPDGRLIFVTPGHSPIVDFGLRVLTGKRADEAYGERRQSLISTLSKYFYVQGRVRFPSLLNSIICLYIALNLSSRLDSVTTD